MENVIMINKRDSFFIFDLLIEVTEDLDPCSHHEK